jgi:hypothetical protein
VAGVQTELIGRIWRPIKLDSSNARKPSKELIVKLKPTLAVTLFAITAVLSLNAGAAADAPPGAKVEKVAPQKRIKPHSHVEEKTGIPQTAPVAMSDKANAANDMSKHFHPRDGK